MWMRATALLPLLAIIVLGGCGERTPIGHFDLYRTGGGMPDSHPHFSLYYKRRLLTDHYGASAIDPRDPDRILFSGDTLVDGPDNPCGTFLYDGRTGSRRQIAPWGSGLGAYSWAPDSCCVLLNGEYKPRVVMLLTETVIDLAAALSSGGRQLELEPLGWSPDSRRVAVIVRVDDPTRRSGSVQDHDLVEITLLPLHADYVATIRSQVFGLWTSDDYSWVNERLTAASTGQRAPITRKTAAEIGWSATPPTSLRTPVPCG